MWQSLKNIYHGCVALIASAYYGFPGRKLWVIGITGTDGKTTTTHLIHHLLTQAGLKASMVSSVYAQVAGKQYDTGFHVTTPDSFMLQKFLRDSLYHGDDFMVLEVTSHGLDQKRVVGIDFEIGVLTNVTHEHLDYHKTYVSYLKTKALLLQRSKIAVLNRDDSSFTKIGALLRVKIITYGLGKDADINPQNFPFKTELPGKYNRYNCLAAIAVAKQIGVKDNVIRSGLSSFVGVKGRFEKIKTKQGISVVIDFAHTPNALGNVLSTVKPMTKNRLIHVFGSAGLRDYTKRPEMGKMSAQFADIIILTEEDYRTENVNQIISEIAKGCIALGAVEMKQEGVASVSKNKKTVFFRIPDRQSAINFAISLANEGDTVILTGKAHEKSLCRGTQEYPWSEHEAVKKALDRRD